MIKKDEKKFLIMLHELEKKEYKKIQNVFWTTEKQTFKLSARDLIEFPFFEEFMPHKRAWYLLSKWSDKNWYDYGVALDVGWLTKEGKEKAEEWKKDLLEKEL